MQILVTGGAGLAGSFIVHELRTRGHAVRIFARPASAHIAEQLGAEVAYGDLADPDSLRYAADGVDGIVHAACTFSGDPAVDIAAMETLLSAWERGPFIFISSLDVYGLARYVPIDEMHPLDEPLRGYGRGKVQCERLLEHAASQQGREDFSILRASHIWGPHPRCCQREIDARVLAGHPVVLPGATEQEWSHYTDAWVDARELAWVAAECLRRPLSEPANVISSHFTWHDFYAELIRLIDSGSRLVHKPLTAITEEELPYAFFYAQNWSYNGERLVRRLGFRPTHRWQDTLAEIVALYRSGQVHHKHQG